MLFYNEGLGDSIRVHSRMLYGAYFWRPSCQRPQSINTKNSDNNTARILCLSNPGSVDGLSMVMPIRAHGIFSYYIANPILFYTFVAGNVRTNIPEDWMADERMTAAARSGQNLPRGSAMTSSAAYANYEELNRSLARNGWRSAVSRFSLSQWLSLPRKKMSNGCKSCKPKLSTAIPAWQLPTTAAQMGSMKNTAKNRRRRALLRFRRQDSSDGRRPKRRQSASISR